jgi:hypothetical protein
MSFGREERKASMPRKSAQNVVEIHITTLKKGGGVESIKETAVKSS